MSGLVCQPQLEELAGLLRGAPRIVIVGRPGSGKTTLATALGHSLRLPTYHLDDYFWHPGWASSSQTEMASTVSALAATSRWIIEGNHFDSFEERLRLSDAVVVVEAPLLVCVSRIARRSCIAAGGRPSTLPRQVRDEREPWAARLVVLRAAFRYKRIVPNSIRRESDAVTPGVMIIHVTNTRRVSFAAKARAVMLDSMLDRLARVDTSREGGRRGTEESVRYEPSRWTSLLRVLPRREVTRKDVFADLGCGKGRVLYMASWYPFRRIVGVEMSSRLCAIAEANMKSGRSPRGSERVDILNTSADMFAVPDDLTVVYMFNPFRGETFARVCLNLIESVRRAPRRLRIVYANPKEHEVLIQSGFSLLRRRRKLHLYELSDVRQAMPASERSG